MILITVFFVVTVVLSVFVMFMIVVVVVVLVIFAFFMTVLMFMTVVVVFVVVVFVLEHGSHRQKLICEVIVAELRPVSAVVDVTAVSQSVDEGYDDC